MMRLSRFTLILLLIALAWPSVTNAGERGLLWRVVQTCLINHQLTGSAFPCLSVETPKGVEAGYAVLRPPTEDTHMIVTPTVRTIGIEAQRLRGDDAPDYFHDAWIARHFVTDGLARQPGRGDVALAVNSRPGRTQDQLHIHVACIRADVQRSLARQSQWVRGNDWTRIKLLPAAPLYHVHFENSQDLAGINLFDRVADGLSIDDNAFDDVTIVVVGAEPSGFFVLARKRIPHSLDIAHGEALLDHDCSAFKAR